MNRNQHLFVTATLVEGHRVASGLNLDPRFPKGTIRQQVPFFKKLGLDLTSYHPGTLNLDISPLRFKPIAAWHTIPNVKWTESFEPETFSFFRTRLRYQGVVHDALIYLPHPSSKPGDHPPPKPGVVEVLCGHLKGISYGDQLEIFSETEDMQIS